MIWTTPTSLNHVTSGFNLKRKHPVYGYVMPHTGTDYRAPTGTPILAVADGVVVRSTWDDRAGNYVRVDHGGAIWTGYSHLSRRDVAVGQRVSLGQRLGLSGATGAAEGAHLHFEVCVAGVKVDPVPWLAARMGPATVGATGPGTPTVPSAPTLTSPAALAARIIEEFDMTSFVRDALAAAYRTEVGRTPGDPELDPRIVRIALAADPATALRAEIEQIDKSVESNRWFVKGVYQEIYKRPGSEAEWDYWISRIGVADVDTRRDWLVEQLKAQPEYATLQAKG